MNFVISHRQTSQSDSNPMILLRNHSTPNCTRQHQNTESGSSKTHEGFSTPCKNKKKTHNVKSRRVLNCNLSELSKKIPSKLRDYSLDYCDIFLVSCTPEVKLKILSKMAHSN